MDEVKWAFDEVLGVEFMEQIYRTLITIVIVLGIIVLLAIIIAVWKSIACGKIKKSMLTISSFPDNEHAEEFISSVKHISPVGRFFARLGRGFSGLSKGECRNIYNVSVAPAESITSENKNLIRDIMKSLGCKGLLESNAE